MTKLFFSILLVMGFLVSSSAAYADKLCIRKKIRSSDTAFAKKFRKISSGSCPRGFKELIDTSSFPGDAGADGADGQAGELRIYGNGARGALSVSGATALTGANHQFTDITINPGAVFTVPSGAVLRCTGTFTNNGTITVTRFAAGASRLGASNSDIELSASSAHPGSTACPAGSGAFGTNADTVLGAPEGCGLNQVSAANILDPGPARWRRWRSRGSVDIRRWRIGRRYAYGSV
ncbi:MAG: hypothetical protein QY326_03200 [Bdellovibrionota bacterium]|nr:MAG: hypothetical protein QY326_03200 [Bdellovibrionota bacterium]